MSQTAAKVKQNCARVGLESQRISGSQFVIPLYVNGKLVDGYRDSGADISLASRKIVGMGNYLPDKRVKIQGIQGGFCEISLAKIHVKSPRFGTNENVEITVGVLESLRLADLLLENDLFQANSKLRDPIEIVNFDVSASPVMDKTTSSESIDNQISETVVTSSDPIEIAAVTRSQSKHTSEINDGDTGPVTQSDETNRMLREMDMTKFKEMQESDSSLNAL